MKTELLKTRKDLPYEKKKKSHLHFLRQWPYIELAITDEDPIRPSLNKNDIVADVLELNPLVEIPNF